MEPRATPFVSASMTRFTLLAFVACSSPGTKTDAPPVNGDGQCGGDDFLSGEVVDWDSGSLFCGVFSATLQAQGQSTIDTTAPNGRIQLCIPVADQTVVNVTPPTDVSQCDPSVGLYQIPGMLVATHAVIATGQLYSTR